MQTLKWKNSLCLLLNTSQKSQAHGEKVTYRRLYLCGVYVMYHLSSVYFFRFSSVVRDKQLCTSWEKKMQAKQEKLLVKQYSLQLKEEKAKQKEVGWCCYPALYAALYVSDPPLIFVWFYRTRGKGERKTWSAEQRMNAKLRLCKWYVNTSKWLSLHWTPPELIHHYAYSNSS